LGRRATQRLLLDEGDVDAPLGKNEGSLTAGETSPNDSHMHAVRLLRRRKTLAEKLPQLGQESPQARSTSTTPVTF
jgi:hypothetical protein